MARRRADDQGAVAKAEKRAAHMLARVERLQDRRRAREERAAKTRRYRLGQMLEGFLFEEPELLAQLNDIVQHEPLEHVRVAFRLVGGGPSWFDKPDGDDAKSVIDTRRVRLGMIAERMLLFDEALRARFEALMCLGREGDGVLVGALDACVGDAHAMGVATEVTVDLLGAAERRLGVDVPVGLEQRASHLRLQLLGDA